MYAVSSVIALASIPLLLVTIPMVIVAIVSAVQPLTIRNKYARAAAVRDTKKHLVLMAKGYASFLGVMAFAVLGTLATGGAA